MAYTCRAALRVGMAASLTLLACETLQNAIANGDTRSLTMHHTHTGEDITVTFKRDGRYDEEGLKKLNWFLRDWRRDEPTRMDPKLFDIVWEVYREMGSTQPVTIISAYRSPATNAMLRRRGRGVAQFSQHMLGKAMDFYIPGVSLEQIRFAGLRLQRGGVGYYPTSGSPFVHLDTGSVRHWPRMTNDQLARVFPNGRTMLAMADVERRGGSARGGAASSETSEAAAENGASKMSDKPKRFLAKLFGFSTDEDEDEAEMKGRSRAAIASAKSEAPAQAFAKAVIPIPVARPALAEPTAMVAATKPQRRGEFALASGSQTPAQVVDARFQVASNDARPGDGRGSNPRAAEARPIEARSVEARAVAGSGFALASDESRPVTLPDNNAKADTPGAIGARGQKFVWMTGPQGQPIEPRPPESVPNPPKPGAIAANDTTASIAPWPVSQRADRVPTEVALAYAADAGSEPLQPRATPMGNPRPAWQAPVRQSQTAALPPPATPAAFTPAVAPPSVISARPRYNDPWLRGVVMAPSVHYSMSVAVLGSQDYRTLRPFLHKPRAIVAMAFSSDPYDGMNSVTFRGPAVTFVPTITFGQQTAQLR